MARPTSVNTDFIPMATGAMGSSPRSMGNIMPGANAMSSRAGTPPAGGTGGIKGIPSRNGGIAVSSGGYMPQPGSPSPNAMPKPGKVPQSTLSGASSMAADILSHGRTLGAVAHLRKVGGNHAHLDGLHMKATAGLAGMKRGGVGTKGRAGGMSGGFGSLGGAAPIAPSAGQNPMGNTMGNPQLPDDTAGG